MTEALALQGGERVLEIGTGSGYAAAILAEIAGDVYTVERIGQLAEKAASTLADLGYGNVHVLHGDGTKGWPEYAPYDGIIVAAGGPKIPESLKEQLKVGGRLVIPVGRDPKIQELVRVTRISEHEYRREDLADVRFVPLIGHEGWTPADQRPMPSAGPREECQARHWHKRSLRTANHSSPSKAQSWTDCSRASATRGSCCLVRPPTARRNSIECASASRATSDLWPSRATGRTPRGSITTCDIWSIRRRSGPLLPASRFGCGATTR